MALTVYISISNSSNENLGFGNYIFYHLRSGLLAEKTRGDEIISSKGWGCEKV